MSARLREVPAALIVYDAMGRVTDASDRAAELLGTRAEAMMGAHAAESGWLITDAAGWPSSENVHPALAALRSRRRQQGAVARVVKPDGKDVWILVDAVPQVDAAGAVSEVVCSIADVTGILTDARLPRPGYGGEAVTAVTEDLAAVRPDPELIMKTVTGTLSKLRAGTWVASLMNKDPSTLRMIAASDSDPDIAEYVQDMQASGTTPTTQITMHVIESGEPFFMPSIAYEEFMSNLSADVREYVERHSPPIAAPVRFMGVIVVPMRARGATVGTLGLFERRGSNPLTERDVRWVQEVADRAGMAAENAQLYIDATHRLERLTALRSVGLAITGSPDLRLTMQVILDQAVAGLGVDAADVLLVNEHDGLLHLVASTGFKSTSIPDYQLPVDEGVPDQVLVGRRIETVTALGAFSQYRRRSLFAREGFKAYGAVPLIARGRLGGVLEVFNRTPLQPDQEWREFLESLGADAAIAIDSSEMSQRLRQAGSSTPARPRTPAPELSRLEREILELVVEGLPNRVIAEKVHLSHHTVKFHVGQLLDKLGVSNRTELARKATQEGWL